MIVSFNMPDPAGSWNHAIIYVSSDGGNTYLPHTPVQAADDVQIKNLIIGQEYYVKVISYTLTDVQSTTPPTNNITITGAAFMPQVIRALEIQGQGNDTTFNGRDVTFEWKSNNPIFGAGVETASNDNLGAGQGEAAPTFKDFKVDIYVGGLIVRTTFPKDNKFIYTHQMNVEDNGGVGVRAFQIRVAERNGYNEVGESAILDVSNPIPDMSGHTPTLTTNLTKGLVVDWSAFTPSDADLQGYKIYIDTSNPPTTLIGEVGSDTKQFHSDGLTASTLHYAKIIPYDVFGAGTVSGVQSKTTAGGVDTGDIAANAVTINGSVSSDGTIQAVFAGWKTIDSIALAGVSGQSVAIWAKLELRNPLSGYASQARIIHNEGGTVQMDYMRENVADAAFHPIALLGVHTPASDATYTYTLQIAQVASGAPIAQYRRLIGIRLKR